MFLSLCRAVCVCVCLGVSQKMLMLGRVLSRHSRGVRTISPLALSLCTNHTKQCLCNISYSACLHFLSKYGHGASTIRLHSLLPSPCFLSLHLSLFPSLSLSLFLSDLSLLHILLGATLEEQRLDLRVLAFPHEPLQRAMDAQLGQGHRGGQQATRGGATTGGGGPLCAGVGGALVLGTG